MYVYIYYVYTFHGLPFRDILQKMCTRALLKGEVQIAAYVINILYVSYVDFFFL